MGTCNRQNNVYIADKTKKHKKKQRNYAVSHSPVVDYLAALSPRHYSPSRLSDISSTKKLRYPMYFPKPPVFKLKDLPVYSKTLRDKNRMGKSLSRMVLGGKYIRAIKEVPEETESERNQPRGPSPQSIASSGIRSRTIEWTNTPVYR